RISEHVKAGIREALAPLHEALSGAASRTHDAVSTIRGFGGLIGENRRMASEIVRLGEELRRLESLREENDQLREVLGFVRASPRLLLPAEIIARDVGGWWQTVRLNRGIRDGVRVGQAVVTAEGLVGRTRDVSNSTADVLLISDPNCRVSVRFPRTGGFGILSGTGVQWNGRVVCRLELINRHLPIRAGDEVQTSGMGGVFPAGLPVGYVDTVETEASGLTQWASVIPHADLALMRIAFVVGSSPGEAPP
ncbi:MAG: rod shape-determining protein MreC, partial [Kiritimatiellia bacterium]|nr:rod shape-determining protein MreC [Kiritimatiellia bacterium]